jgi:hypothetical protein
MGTRTRSAAIHVGHDNGFADGWRTKRHTDLRTEDATE